MGQVPATAGLPSKIVADSVEWFLQLFLCGTMVPELFWAVTKKNRTIIFKYLCPHQAQRIVAKGIIMPFALRGEAQGSINTALAQRAMRLVALTQVKEKKRYRIRITTAVDMADGSTRQHVWKSKSSKYPKGCRTRRDWAAEADFAKGWRPSRERVVGDKSMDGPFVRGIEAKEGSLSTREKRPQDCHQESILLNDAPPEKRGGAREGCGRRKGSYGPKRMRELLHTCEALLKGGMIQCAKEAARGISAAAMLTLYDIESPANDFIRRQESDILLSRRVHLQGQRR